MKSSVLKNSIVLGILVLFVGASVVSGYQINSNPQPLGRGWLYVGGSGPGNYTTIQSAINDANPGDTVFVYNGTYSEHVVVNKTIDLIGENRDTTIIDGGGAGSVVCVTSDGVTISGFTIQNGFHGIVLGSSSNNTIASNNASHNNVCGIYLELSNNTAIIDNTASNNSEGIFLGYSSNNTIIGNNASNNYLGILLISSSNNTIIGNNASHNNCGIYLGYEFSSGNNNHLYHNNLINNAQNAYDKCSNIWDNGYPSGGNYWSDYNGTDTDGDGIGDTPYNIPGGSNQDHYPFMEPNGWVNEPPDLTIDITGGLGINVLVTNNGQTDADNITWWIHVEGGIFGLINTTMNGTIDITAGETLPVVSLQLFGLGPISITVKVDDIEMTASGFILLFFVIGIT
ncbi:hypothetical protein AYK25_02480 [Thermoplasmatales archaeon SM1-50]|nr:MAG: hypothetical protein AYK25_02480 [Thermoplasmatales archaeon SM1-50]